MRSSLTEISNELYRVTSSFRLVSCIEHIRCCFLPSSVDILLMHGCKDNFLSNWHIVLERFRCWHHVLYGSGWTDSITATIFPAFTKSITVLLMINYCMSVVVRCNEALNNYALTRLKTTRKVDPNSSHARFLAGLLCPWSSPELVSKRIKTHRWPCPSQNEFPKIQLKFFVTFDSI